MRHVTLSLIVTAAAGCGGNWSNADLAFANALPRTAELRANLPAGSTSQPLTGVRRDGLVVGDPSNAWAQTKKAVGDYNLILDTLLTIVDRVRLVAPTSRTANARTWGPWADTNNPGFELQVVISQVDETSFAWAIQARPRNGEFFDVLVGAFTATDTARKGRGLMTVPVRNFRDVLKVDQNLAQLDELTIGYVTDAFPRRVEMLFQFKAGATSGLSAAGYTAREQQDGSGALQFQLVGPGPEVRVLTLSSVWNPAGAGRAQGMVTEGLYAGATVTECWGTDGRVTYYAESWAGGQVSGTPDACVTIEGL